MTVAQNILHRLEEVRPNSLPFRTILVGVNQNSREPVVPSECKRELELMIGLDVVEVKDLDLGLLYSITARGRARIS